MAEGLLSDARSDHLKNWVIEHLQGDGGHNPDLADGINYYAKYFVGPRSYPLSGLARICGPENEMPYRHKYDPSRVEHYKKALEEDGALSPLIVVDFLSGNLDIADGNHRYMAMVEKQREEGDIIFCLQEDPQVYGLIE